VRSPLEPADLERFATAAYLVGNDARATAVWTRAHHVLIDYGHVERAARYGFWLSLHMLLAGETAQAHHRPKARAKLSFSARNNRRISPYVDRRNGLAASPQRCAAPPPL